ncbi:MAG: hypothetical protein QGI83_00950 [Candidatus Latescibacteria bacterium]|jgi:hypothetical protein|nr:hypothetical protein [Candidatus Latescibacterota bacterium]
MVLERGVRVLFLDMEDVQARHNVVHSVCEAEKHPLNPVLHLGDMHEWDSVQARPWESRTVIYDEEDRLFKCWYAGTDLSTERWWATGYAESDDGVRWEKPRVGLFEYNGNKENNIVLMGWGPAIKDEGESDPERRYKMLVKGPGKMPGLRAAYSGDGIHWEETAPVEITGWDGNITDMVALLRDDQDPDPERRYKLVWQTRMPSNKPDPPEEGRVKCLACGPDVEHFRGVGDNPILHPNDGLEQENHFVMLSPWRGQYVLLYEYGWYMPNDRGVFGSYCADIRLASSRGGEHYQRIRPDQKVIPRGARGQWDDGMLVISDKPAVKDNTIYLYYGGNGEDLSSWPRDNLDPAYPYRSAGCMRLSRMGLATLPIDRFTCLETGDRETPGWVTTAPVEVASGDGHLVLNASDLAQRRSWVDVEIQDATGKPIPGFGFEECAGVDRDGLDQPVSWKGRSLGDLTGKHIRLRFRLCGRARLHAFGLE